MAAKCRGKAGDGADDLKAIKSYGVFSFVEPGRSDWGKRWLDLDLTFKRF